MKLKFVKGINRRSMKGLDRLISSRHAVVGADAPDPDPTYVEADDVAENAARYIDQRNGFADAVTELLGSQSVGGDRANRGSGRSDILGQQEGDYNDGYADGTAKKSDRYFKGGNSSEYERGYRDGSSGNSPNVLGFDMSSLADMASGFGGGDKKKAGGDDEAAKRERALLAKEKAEADARNRTTLWVVFGVILAAMLGTGTYLVARKK